MDPTHVERGGPTVLLKTELSKPLVCPAGHDRFAGGVAGRMVIVAARRTGFSIAAWPDAHIDRVNCRSTPRERGQCVAERIDLDSSMDQTGVDAAPAPAME